MFDRMKGPFLGVIAGLLVCLTAMPAGAVTAIGNAVDLNNAIELNNVIEIGPFTQIPIQSLLNGLTPPDSYTGGALYVADNLGTLVTSGADRIAVPGCRLATTVADGAQLGPELAAPLDFQTWTLINGSAVDADTFTTSAVGGAWKSILVAGKRYRLIVAGSSTVAFELKSAAAGAGISVIATDFGTYEFVADSTTFYIRLSAAGQFDVSSISVREVIPTWYPTDALGDQLFTSQPVRTRAGVVTQYNDPLWKGMMIAPARTNLYYYSEQLDQWTAPYHATIAVDATTAPNGTATADKIVEAADTNGHFAWTSYTTGSAGDYTYSAFLKAGERTWAYLYCWDGTAERKAFFDLIGGVVGTMTNCTAKIIALADGWYRCEINITAAAGVSQRRIGLSTGDGVENYPGDGASGIYAWGAQYEAGKTASPYIPTTTSTVTRGATVASFNSADRIRSQNCAVWGRVIPGASGQSAYLLSSRINGSNVLYMLAFPTALRFGRAVGGVDATCQISYSYAVNTPFEYQIIWTDKGMAIRAKEDGGGWSAWVENANGNPAAIASTFEEGSANGGSQFFGTYPWLATAYLPQMSSLAEYENWIENNSQLNQLSVANGVWNVMNIASNPAPVIPLRPERWTLELKEAA